MDPWGEWGSRVHVWPAKTSHKAAKDKILDSFSTHWRQAQWADGGDKELQEAQDCKDFYMRAKVATPSKYGE
jgi:hypothetical protein